MSADTFEPDPSQEKAIDLIARPLTVLSRLGVITGGPGTGKTTCLRRALDELGEGTRFELAAPTGKAAKRMSQATGRAARTVHRMLEFHPLRGFQRNRDTPIEAEVVIVDEASMLDIELAAALFDACGPNTRLVLVGDVNQLPPVGPGQPFADLIKSEMVPVARLTQLHRSAQGSWVARNAQRVLAGKALELADAHDFRYVHAAAGGEVLTRVRLEVERFIKEGLGEPQILIPQTTHGAGVHAANRMLQEVFNADRPHADGRERHYLQRDKYTLREGDRVIQTKNDYMLGVFNGDVGTVTAIEPTGARIQMIDGVEVAYTINQTVNLQLAYALTIHRSQGSEFPWVICVVHSTHTHMLTRQLLYTGITRARQGVVIVGDERGLKTAISTGRIPERNTTLVERMKCDIDEVTIDG